MEQLGLDLKHAWRMLRRNRGVTVVAVVTLAIGLGANAAIFTVVNAVLLRPLPYARPERLVSIEDMTYTGEFLELQRRARTFDVAAYMDRQVTLTGQGDPLRARAAAVSPNLISLLGAGPLLGRALTDGDDIAKDGAVVLLSHSLWRSRFGGDSTIVGRRITVDGIARTVIGVMPPEFAFPAATTQLWTAATIDPRDRIALWSTSRRLVGRLRAGASLADAHAEVRTLGPSMRALFPWNMPADYGATAAVVPLRDALVKNVRTTLLLLLGAVSVVLVIACVNVSQLLVARTLARRRELAIRASLGAARTRILAHVFWEGLLLVVLGLAAGVPVAWGSLRILAAWLPVELARPVALVVDVRLLAFGAIAVTGAAVMVGLFPAVRASRIDLAPQLADSQRTGGSRGSRWTSNVLVAAQMALAVVLVVAATLLVRSLRNLTAVSPGFTVDHVLSARISPPSFRFRDVPSRRGLYASVVERIASIPGVSHAAVSDRLPFGGETYGSVFVIEGRPNPATTGEWPLADVSATVSTGFFDALDIDLRAGRGFTAEDSATALRIAIVSETVARRYWLGESPLGRRFTFPGDRAGMRTIVGVVEDVKWERVTDEPKGALYVPLSQGAPGPMRLIVRTAADPGATFEHVRSTVRSLDGDTPVDQMGPLADLVAASVEQPRFAASLLSGFAFAGLLLGAIGIYGTISDHVTERRREIGVRMALGAQRRDVIRTVVGGTFLMVACGAGIGVAIAALVSRVFATLLFGISPGDVTTFVTAGIVLALTALAAAYGPARRAAAVDPLSALRD